MYIGIDWYIIYRSIDNKVCKKREKILRTQEKKLKNLTFNKVIPFASNEVVKNLSSFEFSTEELELLKYGFSHSIQPKQARKTEVFTTFDKNLLIQFCVFCDTYCQSLICGRKTGH